MEHDYSLCLALEIHTDFQLHEVVLYYGNVTSETSMVLFPFHDVTWKGKYFFATQQLSGLQCPPILLSSAPVVGTTP